MLRAILAVLVLMTSPPAASAPRSAAAGEARMNEIRSLTARANAALRGVTPAFYCEGEEGAWSVGKAGLEDERCHVSAQVFTVSGDIRKVVLGLWTPSGDWTSHVELYFDEKGRTAFRFERLVTYYGGDETLTGPFEVETRTYYAPDGAAFRETVKAQHQATRRRVSPQIVYRQKTPRPLTAAALLLPKGGDAAPRRD